MKKITTLLVALAVCSVAWSQSKPRLGIKGGLSFTNIHAKATVDGRSETDNGNRATGFHGGLFADVPLGRAFHFRPEFQVARKGADLNDGDTKLKLRPAYLELPLNFVYYATGRSGTSFFVGGGPAMAVGIGGNIEMEGLKVDIFKTMYKRFDLGLNLIAGVDLKGGFNASVSVNRGLLNINKAEVEQENADVKIMNNAINFSIGYLFNRK